MKVINVKNLSKQYKKFEAVKNVSFEVEEGTIFGLLGPNGAGKTTTVECMAGVKRPTSGTVHLLDMNVHQVGKALYDHIGIQLQETSYQDKVKVIELVRTFAAMYDDPIDYLSLLKRFGLEQKHNNYVNDLSGGQRQKVAITLALIGNPKVVFLDELTTGLDPKSRREMWELVLDLKKQGITVFMTTHYMEEASYLCDQIAIIDEGKIMVIDDVEGVIKSAKLRNEVSFSTNQSIQSFSSDLKNISDLTIDVNGDVVKVSSSIDSLITKVILSLEANTIKYNNVKLKNPTLEDAYLKLTGKKWSEQ